MSTNALPIALVACLLSGCAYDIVEDPEQQAVGITVSSECPRIVEAAVWSALEQWSTVAPGVSPEVPITIICGGSGPDGFGGWMTATDTGFRIDIYQSAIDRGDASIAGVTMHEIGHALFGQSHVEDDPWALMAPMLSEAPLHYVTDSDVEWACSYRSDLCE